MASILESAREDRRTSQIPHDISCSGVASSPRMIKPIEYLRSRSDERLEYGDTLSSCPDFSLSKRIDIYKGAPAKIENIWVIHFYTCLPCAVRNSRTQNGIEIINHSKQVPSKKNTDLI